MLVMHDSSARTQFAYAATLTIESEHYAAEPQDTHQDMAI